jgi:2'-5' RNA ligase
VRAVWVGVEREPALHHLRDKVESAVVRAGLPPERQKYTPHVTLARPKSTPAQKLYDYFVRHSRFRSEPFEVTHFDLYQSFLKREGAVYRVERSYELSPY